MEGDADLDVDIDLPQDGSDVTITVTDANSQQVKIMRQLLLACAEYVGSSFQLLSYPTSTAGWLRCFLVSLSLEQGLWLKVVAQLHVLRNFILCFA